MKSLNPRSHERAAAINDRGIGSARLVSVQLRLGGPFLSPPLRRKRAARLSIIIRLTGLGLPRPFTSLGDPDKIDIISLERASAREPLLATRLMFRNSWA
jgi:hypothetical protein